MGLLFVFPDVPVGLGKTALFMVLDRISWVALGVLVVVVVIVVVFASRVLL